MMTAYLHGTIECDHMVLVSDILDWKSVPVFIDNNKIHNSGIICKI